MAADLDIRRATDADTERIVELLRVSLGEGAVPRTVDYWSWKHLESPFGRSPCLVAESGGRLVGVRVFMRWRWRARGAEWRAARAVDTATHPDWRGKGVFRRLTLSLLDEMAEEGTAFVFNTPNGQSRPGYLKMGWESVGRVSLWVRLLPAAWLGSSTRRRRGPRVTPRPGAPFGRPARELLLDPRLPLLLHALPEEGDRLRTVRDLRYLRWRYGSVPGFDYRARWRIEGRDGAAVIARIKRGGRLDELRICELLVGSGASSLRMGRRLLRSVIRDTDAHCITAMAMGGTPSQPLLLRCGFVPAPRMGPVMTVRPLALEGNGVDPLHRSHWDLSVGDLELF
jgi:GNAT superfamily N-acetyltransferase